ncbi:uncharacterized protein LOC142981782 [Anticarsia gemmatalis]|uniref:uncharacterized protein LOC142981782 n=1 Tax=Anticarsia gemmatalis TaxID=129554 RepID=UPI003F775A5E
MLVPVMLAWTTSGHLLRDFTSREFNALYIALERPVLVLLGAALIFGTYNDTSRKNIKKVTSTSATNGHSDSNGTASKKSGSHGFLMHIFSWRIWYPLGRMSLSVVMLHWSVNMLLKAANLTPVTSTLLEMAVDTIATAFFTYLLAVPVTLCVEIPFTKLISKK